MKRFIIIFLLIVQLSTVVDVVGGPVRTKWQLEIALDKQQYLSYEPIWLDVVLTNISGDTLRFWGFPPPCHGSFDIIITDSAGHQIDYMGMIIEYAPAEGWVLNPHEAFYDSFDLLQSFGSGAPLTFPRLLPGRYAVQASFGVISNKVDFQVIELSESEGQQLKILKDVFHREFRKKHSPDKSAEIDLTPFRSSSPFAEVAAVDFLGHEEFIDRYPESGNTIYSLDAVTKSLAADKKREYLEGVMAKYKGTRAARHAEQMLKLLGKK